MWILIDISNGDALEVKNAGKIYYWTFETKALALKFKRDTAKKKYGATLVGPFKRVYHPSNYPSDGRYYSLRKR